MRRSGAALNLCINLEKLHFYYVNDSFQKHGLSFHLFRTSFMPLNKMLWLCFHIGAVPFLVNVVSHILQFIAHVNEISPLVSNF